MPAPYLIWLVLFVVLPTLLLWLFEWRLLWRYRRVFVIVIAFALLFGVSWDLLAFKLQLWGWPAECCRAWVGPLPIEELLFMIFVPLLFASLTLVAREIIRHHRRHR